MLATRGSNLKEIVQSNDNGRAFPNFDTTLPGLMDREEKLTSKETRHEEPMKLTMREKVSVLNAKRLGQRVRFCPENNSQVRSLSKMNKQPNQN